MLKRFSDLFSPDSPEMELLLRIDPARLPRHIAITMDGNGRWAAARNLPRIEGHRQGAEIARETCETAARLGLEHLTLYTFSAENWKRPAAEVRFLMEMLYSNLMEKIDILERNNIRLKVLGDPAKLPLPLRRRLAEVEKKSAANSGLQVNLALNYGSRQEIVQAVRRMIGDDLKPRQVTEKSLAGYLYTASIPDPDLLIRTSGEMRISNFLLFQIAYSELAFTPVLWPDFRPRDLFLAISEYQKRQRRFGAL
jgi:undecaprenyl diphosphate synthase